MAEFPYCLILSSCLAWFVFLVAIELSLAESTGYGFMIDLIHRDSPKSPSYNPSARLVDRHLHALRRSLSRIKHLRRRTNRPSWRSSKKDVQSELSPAGGEYYMEIALGTPPLPTLGIADTGSDLTWTQCKPCRPCYPQDPPIFDPKRSLTYNLVPCRSDACHMLGNNGFCSQERTCQYNYGYGDGSVSKGDLATESITLGLNSSLPVTVPGVPVGCGHNNTGIFDSKGSGIIGLGGGPLSLISHMDHLIQGKFSYCLVPFTTPNATSKINFGECAILSGEGVASTPLIRKSPGTFYYITLESISLGTKNLPPKISNAKDLSSLANEVGNMIVDSGTTYNFIPTELYKPFESALLKVIQTPQVQVPEMGLCFNTTTDLAAPPVILQLTGANLLLKSANIFTRLSDDAVCLTIFPTRDVPILGNFGQADFEVGFDLEKRTVSFKPTDCTGSS
ncbi:aspartic proteinase CDR1 [Punica granatum]|uniref:Peptidase A1 domain-containing protein n=2 Tax=Punica granatum TaxID=22663 RepID=A0A218VWR7_PUNGR|nr:aspartic proteinase CDR1 [Punica granatum]OWM65027.1 hypothetical protein CDL15_Pgr028745 [Punica granatum]PKI44039.1 hypothetical protein CRG98_035569 [Punica granatum]